MFLFHIPFKLSWKQGENIKQWLYKYFCVCLFLSVSLSYLYYVIILGHWEWSVLFWTCLECLELIY
jgi:hypothetical protein